MIGLRRRLLDIWSVPVVLAVAGFLLFLLYPIFSVVKSSLFGESGSAFTLASYLRFFSIAHYYRALFNTLALGALGTVGILLIDIPLAYLYTRYRMPGHVLIGTALWVPYLTPAFIGAYTWLILFGRFGLVTELFKGIAIAIPAIHGFGGILAVFILSYYPLGFILLIGAFQSVDPTLEEAAHNLGASGMRRFFTVTLPGATPSILNAALLVFILIIDSFGIPAIVGVGTPVLTTLVYGEFNSELGGPPVMAATGATILLAISMTMLVVQRVYLRRRSFVAASPRRSQLQDPSPGKKVALVVLFWGVLLVSLLPICTIILSSFTEARGPVLQYGSFTLDHYRETLYAVARPLRNSYLLATTSMILDLLLGALLGYVIVRKGRRLATFLDAFVALPLGIPGVLLGIGLILAYSRGPLILVGTGAILVVAYFVRRLPHPVRTVSAILAQVDPSVEEASINLGAPPSGPFSAFPRGWPCPESSPEGFWPGPAPSPT